MEVKVKINDSVYQIVRRDSAEFTRLYSDFYTDKEQRFYIMSMGHAHDMSPVPVYIEIPRIDSASFKQDGQYFWDKSRVICVFGNSDGGSYAPLKGVDPGSFRVFKNVFGGKDKDHVYFQNRLLEGLSPAGVRVYSEYENCANCDGYFKEGKIVYRGRERIKDTAFVIPERFRFLE